MCVRMRRRAPFSPHARTQSLPNMPPDECAPGACLSPPARMRGARACYLKGRGAFLRPGRQGRPPARVVLRTFAVQFTPLPPPPPRPHSPIMRVIVASLASVGSAHLRFRSMLGTLSDTARKKRDRSPGLRSPPPIARARSPGSRTRR
jgi:hypothetical protein